MARKNSLLSALGEKYHAIEHNGGFLLYDNTRQGKRSNVLYLGKIFLSTDGKKYVFNDDYYESVDTLVKAIEDYNATLPFDADVYNPIYRKNYKIECILHDYLDSLGFKHSYSSSDTLYSLPDAYGQAIVLMKFDVKEDSEDGVVRRLIPNTGKWVEAKFNDVDSAIGACNSIIAAQCAIVNAQLVELLGKMTKHRVGEFMDMTFDIKSLSTYSEDAKKKTIEQLEEELKRLKEL